MKRKIEEYYNHRDNIIKEISKEIVKIGVKLSKTKAIKKELCCPKCASCLVVEAKSLFEDKHDLSLADGDSAMMEAMFDLANKIKWDIH